MRICSKSEANGKGHTHVEGAQRPKAPDGSAPNKLGPANEDESRKFTILAHFEFNIFGRCKTQGI